MASVSQLATRNVELEPPRKASAQLAARDRELGGAPDPADASAVRNYNRRVEARNVLAARCNGLRYRVRVEGLETVLAIHPAGNDVGRCSAPLCPIRCFHGALGQSNKGPGTPEYDMRRDWITSSLLKRCSHRPNLSLLLLVGGMYGLFRVLTGPPGISLLELSAPLVVLLAHLLLSPLPWQWTGDARPKPGLGRGFLQALGFNLAWVLLLLSLLHLTGPEGPHGLAHHGPPPPLPLGPERVRLPGLGLALLNVTFAIIFGWVLAEKEATEVREQAMATLLRQSRRRALQGQLEPHVLYNALNGLAELVHEDPLAAEEMIARLADLYRMLTLYGEADLVPLVKERVLVETYLSMEEMRLGDRLKAGWDWPSWADQIMLPPLFLQPLVENAIKHGISPCEEGGALRISLTREGPTLALAVANGGRAIGPGARDGIGLANLKARLELWTGRAAGFTLEQQDRWTVATIRWTEAAR